MRENRLHPFWVREWWRWKLKNFFSRILQLPCQKYHQTNHTKEEKEPVERNFDLKFKYLPVRFWFWSINGLRTNFILFNFHFASRETTKINFFFHFKLEVLMLLVHLSETNWTLKIEICFITGSSGVCGSWLGRWILRHSQVLKFYNFLLAEEYFNPFSSSEHPALFLNILCTTNNRLQRNSWTFRL